MPAKYAFLALKHKFVKSSLISMSMSMRQPKLGQLLMQPMADT
jgi:hypothetical protein